MSQKQWLSTLKNELSNSTVASNVLFTFIMLGLEKMVELEFECPCTAHEKNLLFSVAFFIIPAIMAFLLMMIVQECSPCCQCCINFCSSFVSAVVWLILVFLDGQYYACAKTDWEGRFVQVDKAALLKWCEPESDDKEMLHQLMRRTQGFFVESQVIGILLLIFLCVILVFYKPVKMICDRRMKETKDPNKDASMKLKCNEDISVL